MQKRVSIVGELEQRSFGKLHSKFQGPSPKKWHFQPKSHIREMIKQYGDNDDQINYKFDGEVAKPLGYIPKEIGQKTYEKLVKKLEKTTKLEKNFKARFKTCPSL